MLTRQKMNKKHINAPLALLKARDGKSLSIAGFFLLLLLLMSACGANAPVDVSATAPANPTPKQPVASQASPIAKSAAQTPATHSIKVYFSRLPQSKDDFSAVFPVERLSPTNNMGTFAIQQLVVGPNATESASGYFSELENHLAGPSTCQPAATQAGFTLSLNIKGAISEEGTATLKFCHLFLSPGVGTDARATAEINATLKQFPDIKKVVILTQDAHCFGDESGADMCLR